MHDRLMVFLLRSEVKKLTEEKRSLYQFVIELEDSLAESAETADHFLSLLVENSPYELAGRHFKLPITKVVHLMTAIEVELTGKIETRCGKMKWVDYTDHLLQTAEEGRSKKLFLFIN